MPGQDRGYPPCQQVEGGTGDGPRLQLARGPIPVEGGDPPARQHALSAHGMPEKEGGLPQSQGEDDGEGASPKQHAHLAHGMHGQGDPSPRTTSTQRGPPEQRGPQGQGVQGGGGDGAGP